MIRVYYKRPNPAGGWFQQVHSIPCADLAQFELRRSFMEYGLDGVKIVGTEPIDTSAENAAADYYERYGTAGEF